MPTKEIHVEYEIPPLRAVYWSSFYDDGQTDEEIAAAFSEQKPRAKIRKITRVDLTNEPT